MAEEATRWRPELEKSLKNLSWGRSWGRSSDGSIDEQTRLFGEILELKPHSQQTRAFNQNSLDVRTYALRLPAGRKARCWLVARCEIFDLRISFFMVNVVCEG
eukprot:164404-Hanusia_phi.AAC.3